jgi:alkylhydroperoxidase family enzyme
MAVSVLAMTRAVKQRHDQGMTEESTEPDSAATRALDAAGYADDLDPHLAPFFQTWLDVFIFGSRLDARLRELAILRIMWRCDRAFEWGHHYRLARGAAVTREEVLAIRTPTPERDLDPVVATVVRAADEVVEVGTIGVDTMAALANVFDAPGLLDELLYVLAGYRMFATVAASRRESTATSHPVWPPDGVGPGAAQVV